MGRTKNLKRSRRDDDEDEEVASDQEVKSSSKAKSKPSKKAKTSSAADSGKDDDGNSFWSLGGTRRATVSGFKGKTFINIREYWTDASGDLKPGKKGIMLTPEQYNKLLEVIPSINAELQEKGIETADISSAPTADAPESPAKTKLEKKAKSQEKKTKANIEATSDEDEESE
ncbi:PC4-domain-containing protein [Hypoxylon trugodes]|uniref:PC4-domain-containing protein n=1 Tax=Hypoxylon trugodes TaxID=326681 RepID=UPI00219ADFE5|nr:PC4-domain-containing protein [Hypoxylon trugodes]KAI1389764.1 PC4-domain-containing protein [Hypoxylon trugodes]